MAISLANPGCGTTVILFEDPLPAQLTGTDIDVL